jgi:hypothetical protein
MNMHSNKKVVILVVLLLAPLLVASIGAGEDEWIISAENTSATAGDTGHVIPITGTWAKEIRDYYLLFQYDPDVIEISNVSLEGTVAEFEVAPGEFQYWQLSVQYDRWGLENSIWATVLRDNESLTIPAGTGTLFKIIVNINDTASSGNTTIDLVQLATPAGCIFIGTDNTINAADINDGILTITEANNPPNTPSNPNPSHQAINIDVDADLSWTGGDPDGDPVTYQVYFGTNANPSLVTTTTQTAYDPGTLEYSTKYYWKITGTDPDGYSATGPVWEFTTDQEPPPVEQQLVITAPSMVTEGESFQVTVTAEGSPVAEVQVTFIGSQYYTTADGLITLAAPAVEADTDYTISAAKTGYISDTTTITVLNEADTGWVQGVVVEIQENATIPLENAMVCLILSEENNEITSRCTFTDETGSYTLSAPMGTYTVKAGKKGYITETVDNVPIHGNTTTWVNFTLEQGTGDEPGVFPVIIETYRDEINDAIAAGSVGAEIIIQKGTEIEYESTVISFDAVHINLTNMTEDQITLTVDGDAYTLGKTIVISVEGFTFDQELEVEYDGNIIAMADDIFDVLDSNDDGLDPEYLVTLGANGMQLLVSNPHFSQHEIKIYSSKGLVEAVEDITAVLVYIVIAIIVAVVFVGTGELFKRL